MNTSTTRCITNSEQEIAGFKCILFCWRYTCNANTPQIPQCASLSSFWWCMTWWVFTGGGKRLACCFSFGSSSLLFLIFVSVLSSFARYSLWWHKRCLLQPRIWRSTSLPFSRRSRSSSWFIYRCCWRFRCPSFFRTSFTSTIVVHPPSPRLPMSGGMQEINAGYFPRTSKHIRPKRWREKKRKAL